MKLNNYITCLIYVRMKEISTRAGKNQSRGQLAKAKNIVGVTFCRAAVDVYHFTVTWICRFVRVAVYWEGWEIISRRAAVHGPEALRGHRAPMCARYQVPVCF
jgi:hypothetical protein